MNIRILQGLAGARQAEGLTVIIDVFRAFSLECYMYACGCAEVIPTAGVDETFAMRAEIPGCILAGERNGRMVDGFDYGNSPSQFEHLDLSGKTVIHTTSAGVQGLAAAVHADEIITGALVNARAIADYIREKCPDTVSLVAMGWNGIRETEEDTLCAEYIRSLLEDQPLADISERALALREQEGRKFFDPDNDIFPERDFWLCIRHDVFDGVIRVSREAGHLTTQWIKI